MKINELSGDAKFLFMTTIQAALKMKSLGKNEDDFVNFTREIWKTMEMNDKDDLEDILFKGMMTDLERFSKNKYKK